MYRRLGMLVLFVSLFVLTGSGLVPTSAAFATTNASFVADDEGDAPTDKPENGEEGEEKEEPKKDRNKMRPYAKRLDAKTKEPGPPPSKPKYKPWGKVITKDHEKHEGLITVYTKQEEVLFELGEDDFDKPMLAILSLSQGIGSHFVFGGLPVDQVMFDFHRNEDHVQVRRLTAQYRAPGDEALENAIDLTFSESILVALPIKTEKDGNVVVDVAKFYLSDVSGMSLWLGAVFNMPVRQNSKLGYYKSIKNFPENTEIDTRLTYSPANVIALNLPNVPDPRAVQIGVSYSIRKLPEEPMMPRLGDNRVGYFPTSHMDFTREGKESFFVHYANRWRLVKKDSTAALSEPVEPIVYYVDHTIPEEYRPFIMKGIEIWQRAFEKAGFKNAIIAKAAPTPEEDPDYDPLDARYNTIRWNVSDTPLYGAIGPSQVDPRTGEIISSDIIFEHAFVAGRAKIQRRLAEPRTALMSVDPYLKQEWMTDEERANHVDITKIPQLRNRAQMMCNIQSEMALSTEIARLSMLANGLIGANDDMPMEFIGEALVHVTAHEVGHAIGLRHNFKSSGSTPYTQLNDKALIEEIGMAGSVMDYNGPNVALNPADQGYYYGPTVGTYDMWAIEWGYSEVDGDTPDEQRRSLEPITSKSTDKAHLYGTDEDTYPLGALDPRTSIWDLGDDPAAWSKDFAALCDRLLHDSNLESSVVAEGDDYYALRNAVQYLFVMKFIANNTALKSVGGQYVQNVTRGSGALPFEPVAVAEQTAALQFVLENGLNTETYLLDNDLLNKLQDDRMWSWQNNLFQPGRRFDFPLTLWVGGINNGILANLMNPLRQARIVEATYQVDKPFRLSDLYSGLTRAIWTSKSVSSGKTAVWDRNLQRVYTDRLIAQVMMPHPALPQDAIALSRLNLSRIRTTAQSALARQGLGDETNAHLMETIARIDRALDAQRMTGF